MDSINEEIAKANIISPGVFLPAFQAKYVNMINEVTVKLRQPIAKSVHK